MASDGGCAEIQIRYWPRIPVRYTRSLLDDVSSSRGPSTQKSKRERKRRQDITYIDSFGSALALKMKDLPCSNDLTCKNVRVNEQFNLWIALHVSIGIYGCKKH